ncbi:hypothetical protein BC827DRAFT_785144 [Russula dissimulans]|nr:hypothetical protein BC827DRAFT_785144 [Russula dissimulans]
MVEVATLDVDKDGAKSDAIYNRTSLVSPSSSALGHPHAHSHRPSTIIGAAQCARLVSLPERVLWSCVGTSLLQRTNGIFTRSPAHRNVFGPPARSYCACQYTQFLDSGHGNRLSVFFSQPSSSASRAHCLIHTLGLPHSIPISNCHFRVPFPPGSRHQ